MPSKLEMIQILRSLSGQQVSISQCLNVLEESQGDLESAKALLRARYLVEQRHSSKAISSRASPDAPEGWAYILHKVDRYMRLGAEKYRRGDALQMPDLAWEQECLDGILRCFQQFALGKGYRADSPVENVGISEFSAALRTLHFRKLKQVALQPMDEERQEGMMVFIDKVQFVHFSIDLNLWLFNKAVYDDSE